METFKEVLDTFVSTFWILADIESAEKILLTTSFTLFGLWRILKVRTNYSRDFESNFRSSIEIVIFAEYMQQSKPCAWQLFLLFFMIISYWEDFPGGLICQFNHLQSVLYPPDSTW